MTRIPTQHKAKTTTKAKRNPFGFGGSAANSDIPHEVWVKKGLLGTWRFQRQYRTLHSADEAAEKLRTKGYKTRVHQAESWNA